MAHFSMLLIAVSTAVRGMDTHAVPGPDKPFSALSCRLMNISGGRHKAGALIDSVSGSATPIHVFWVGSDNRSSASRIILKSISSPNLQSLSKLSSAERDYLNFYWSDKDEFVSWAPSYIWWMRKGQIDLRITPEFKQIRVDKSYFGLFTSNRDVIPEHFNAAPRYMGSGVDVTPMQFDLNTETVSRLAIPVGLHNSVGWTASDTFVRLRPNARTRQALLDVFDREELTWKSFSSVPIPDNAKLLLVRNSPKDQRVEVMVTWLDDHNLSRIGLFRNNSSAPEIIFSGNYQNIFVSPDRTQIYGFTDGAGRFHRIRKNPLPRPISFWLSKFEALDGIQNFYLLENNRYAFIKRNSVVSGAEIVILSREGSNVRMIYKFC